VPRRLRVRFLETPGRWLHVYSGYELPEDGVFELPEAEAANLLRDRRFARSWEVLGWVDDESPSVPERSSD
jgi:hypothetical protein